MSEVQNRSPEEEVKNRSWEGVREEDEATTMK